QAELVRLATTLLHSINGAANDAKAKANSALPLYVLTPLTMPDGRNIHYRVAGAPRGRPFLLLPSGQGFIRWTDEAELQMARRDLQMIVPVRAGYGPSSSCPTRANIYDTAADDVAQLLGYLGVKSCPVVAICDDIKLALHTEQRHPGIFTAIVGASATMPLSTPAQFARLTKFVRFIQSNATFAPRTLPYVSLLFFHMARRLGTRRFLETMMGNCAADLKALQDPGIAGPLEASTEIVITQHFMAHQSWSREIVEFAKPWAHLLLGTRTPITLLAGVDDPFSPIVTVREYCMAKPAIILSEIPDAGQTLVYTHHNMVLDAVERAMQP
uniref:alpha/beta hydrolase n=1 Tax=Tabrizicola sp. TaxID=2005166 RepID=UPI003864E495